MQRGAGGQEGPAEPKACRCVTLNGAVWTGKCCFSLRRVARAHAACWAVHPGVYPEGRGQMPWPPPWSAQRPWRICTWAGVGRTGPPHVRWLFGLAPPYLGALLSLASGEVPCILPLPHVPCEPSDAPAPPPCGAEPRDRNGPHATSARAVWAPEVALPSHFIPFPVWRAVVQVRRGPGPLMSPKVLGLGCGPGAGRQPLSGPLQQPQLWP